jgi:hypothetical protein
VGHALSLLGQAGQTRGLIIAAHARNRPASPTIDTVRRTVRPHPRCGSIGGWAVHTVTSCGALPMIDDLG